ncbi:hypothetical protein [Rhizobium mesoamericanum]|nr:hypothetical protein [Rhizobium mesoamericanum]
MNTEVGSAETDKVLHSRAPSDQPQVAVNFAASMTGDGVFASEAGTAFTG